MLKEITEDAMKTVNTENTLNRFTFTNGKFRLEEISCSKLRLRLSKDPSWEREPNDSFSTPHLGAAKKFQKYADDRVKKIFKKAFQEHYEIDGRIWDFSDVKKNLDESQKNGLRWVLSRKRSYLAHAPGAGKTAIAIIASCLSKGIGQTLFIVPPGLTLNWVKEIEKFAPWAGNYADIAVVPKSKDRDQMNWSASLIICPDSMLCKEWVYDKLVSKKEDWKFIAVDEASRFKEPTSERSLRFYGGVSEGRPFKGIFQNARHVVLMDGSPMPNRPIELWAPAFALHPNSIDCRGYDDFGYRYCGAKPNERGVWEYRYSSNEAELKEKLTADFMHVVTEEELDHPERRRSMLFMDKDVRSVEHREWERRHLKGLVGPSISETTALTDGELQRYRKQLGVRKVPWVDRYVSERLENKNEFILLFAWHVDVCLELAARLCRFKPGLIIGMVEESLRQKFFQEFQEGKRRLLILNIQAGGRGHNLQKADRVIFAEWSWTDELNKQAEKRASRKGSEKSFVRCEYIVAPDSMDEMVLQSVFTKEKRVKRIIG